ncbi:hypothetical protein Tco_0995181 [Tanacetum coccineum]
MFPNGASLVLANADDKSKSQSAPCLLMIKAYMYACKSWMSVTTSMSYNAWCANSSTFSRRCSKSNTAPIKPIGEVDRDNYVIVLKMCKDKKDKDPNFQYNFKLH